MSDNEQLIKQLVDRIAPHVKGRGDFGDLLDMVKRGIWRREDEQSATDFRVRREAFKAEYAVIGWPDFAAKYSLHEAEHRAARLILPTRDLERGLSYFVDTEPTADQRQRSADETPMSKRQACEYLGISPGKFDRLKKQHRLEHVGTFRAGGETASGYPPVAYLYRLSDIRALLD
jgi:hypothetical protein